MNQQIIYLHGGSAYSSYDDFMADLREIPLRDLPGKDKKVKWTESIADNLGSEYEVFRPTMPNKQNAKYDEWKIWFERYLEHLNNGAILIGYSLGGFFLVKYLTENSFSLQVRALILLAPPFENFLNPELSREDDGDFAFDPANLSQLKTNVEKIIILHSEDDFVVPYEHALQYKTALPEAELVTFTDKNHFLVPELPDLAAMIREIAKAG